jgi:DNA transposition AAA+ family ATPase
MIPATGSLSATLRAQVRTAVEEHMKRRGLPQKALADAIGTSATYINNLFTNAASLPEATQDRLWRDLNNWLEREARAEEAERPDDFVRTFRVAERGWALATHLSERADMAIAYGPAGIGKTTVFEAFCAENPTAVMVTAGHDTRTPKKLLRVVFNALSGRRRREKDVDAVDVIERLRMPPRVKSRSLLIVDQGHELLHSKGVVRLLMELHDRAQCSVLLVGTRDLKTYVASDSDPEFGQLSSRIGMRIELAPEIAKALRGGGKRSDAKCFSVADIRRLFAGGKLKVHPDVVRMLCEIANGQRGTLRRVVRLHAWAETAARQAGSTTINMDHLEAAARLVEEDAALPVPLEAAPEELVAAAAG